MVPSNLKVATNRRLSAASLAALAFVGQSPQAASAAETKTYVVSWFNHAVYSQDGDCPQGRNPSAPVWAQQILTDMGKTPAEVEDVMKDFPDNADAYPDPKTGENDWISAAYVIESIPAFAVHPSDNKTSRATLKRPIKEAR